MPLHTGSHSDPYPTRAASGPGRLARPCGHVPVPLLMAVVLILAAAASVSAQSPLGTPRVATATPMPSPTPLPPCPYTPVPTPNWSEATDTPMTEPTLQPLATPLPGSLEIMAWHDGDGDGLRDAGEPGWGGLSAGVSGRDVLLDDDGRWTGEMPPGPVSLAVHLPAGYLATTAPALQTELSAGGHVALHVGIGLPPTDPPTPSRQVMPVPTAVPTRTPATPKQVEAVLPAAPTATALPPDTPTATSSPQVTPLPAPTSTATATPVDPVAAGSGVMFTCSPPRLEVQPAATPFPADEFFLGLGLLGLAVLAAGERVRSVLRQQERSQVNLGLQQLALQRAALGRTIAVSAQDLLDVVNRIAFDVLGEAAGMDQLLDVRTEPPLAVTFARQHGRFFAFTPFPDQARPFYPGGHWFAVDALTAHPFVAEELAAVYATALAVRQPQEPSLQPRSQVWGLVVWDPPQRPRLDRLCAWLQQHLPRSRWWLRRAWEVGR